ncbi:VIT and vWA domain-containing protein [Portibacter lacus]|uniref:Inter-alpha-trypsin inhibitor domain-containing protein n=1 Tax=Portibacter lacus TaxID=1099794 RepID=A0AA37SPU3_9BACT|nr:VIT and VWA domain-containing protein [Portibacter lacus]GLR18571.1 inter-alpha-trypsin inhibitor domain-containing protein [Portibacter lacus]
MYNPKLKLPVFILAMMSMFNIYAQQGESPYFVIENAKPGAMPLEANKAEVYISGIIADVTLTQTYRNNSDSIIEAVYVFPGSAQSAVYDMEMQIGNRIIKAELKEKEEARKTYEKAKSEGKRTSLLEQHRPNVFQMNVANILPGERIDVRIKYTEKIIPTHGDYQFTLPTVVGPRYHEPSKDNPATFVNMPYSKENKKPEYSYDIDIYLQAGQTIQKISSHSHQVNITKFNDKIAHIGIHDSELFAGNKDFVLNYRLAENNISSGLMLYEHEAENFFLANIQPPNILTDAQVPAKEYIFIVDISGSMYGFPLEVSKKVMKDLLKGLKPSDKFNVMLFAGTSYMFSDTSMYAEEETINNVINSLEEKQGGGSTQLLPALQKAINLPRVDGGLSRSLVVVTDGYISIEKETFELVRNNLDKANVFAFGIGSSTNRFLIEGLANVGQGLPFIIENEEVACDIANDFVNYISTPSLSNIKIRYEGFDAYDVEPKSIPDLLGERPINIIGKWKGNPNGKIIIDGYFAGNKYSQVINISDYTPDSKNKALRLLWAREKIRLMDDYRKVLYDETHKQEMTDLSLKYNLLSAYTSFVAVDYEVAHEGGEPIKTVKQALPLPLGVSNNAIGAEMSIKKVSVAKTGQFLKIGNPSGIEDEVLLASIRLKFVMKISALKKCFADQELTEILLTLKFNEEGMLGGIDFSGELSKEAKECLREQIISWDFSTLNIEALSDVLVPLTIS